MVKYLCFSRLFSPISRLLKPKSHPAAYGANSAGVFEASLESSFVDMGSSEGARDSGVNNKDGDEDDVVRML